MGLMQAHQPKHRQVAGCRVDVAGHTSLQMARSGMGKCQLGLGSGGSLGCAKSNLSAWG